MDILAFSNANIRKVTAILGKGSIAVIPTDTLYGITGQALNKKIVERIYKIRKRASNKPFIVLINSFADLAKLGIEIGAEQKEFLKKVWPGPVSVILPCSGRNLKYLHRGTKTLAVRMPANYGLRLLIKKTGPLVAPSANTEGKPPAKNTQEAYKYFGQKVDVYLNAGKIISKPSTLVSLESGKFKILRQGAVKI